MMAMDPKHAEATIASGWLPLHASAPPGGVKPLTLVQQEYMHGPAALYLLRGVREPIERVVDLVLLHLVLD